jgi:hypothetical protein
MRGDEMLFQAERTASKGLFIPGRPTVDCAQLFLMPDDVKAPLRAQRDMG